MSHLQRVLGLPQSEPAEMLTSYRRSLFQACKDLFLDIPSVLPNMPGVEIQHIDGTTVVVHVSPQTTLAQLCRAEVDLTQQELEGQWCDARTGETIAWDEQVASRSIRVVPYQFTEVAHGSEVGHVPLPSIPALTMMDFFDDHSPRELLDAHEASEAGVSANSCPFGRVPEPKQSPEVCSVPELFRTSEAGESTNLGGPVMTARSESIADVSVCPKASEAGESSVSPSHVSPALAVVSASSNDTREALTSLVDSVPPDVLIGLKHLRGPQLAALILPLVKDARTCRHMRNEVVSNVSRLDVLSREGSAMGDDEVNLHAHACMLLANNPNLEFLDPLMASTCLKVGNGDQVQEWLAMTPDVNCIATVVHWNDHWSPVVWKKGITEVQVSMWEHEDVDVSALYPLHGLISVAWGMPMFAVACSRRSYAKSHCGAAAVAFLAHMLIDAALPQTEEEMLAFHKALRDRFTAAVHNLYHVPKPWCWGLGTPDVLSITASLLHLHGVPQPHALSRAKLVVQSLGRSEVQKAVTGVSPWKSLKSLANLQSPPLQLIMPDEAAQKVIAKQSTKPAKSTVTKSFAPARPADMDPSKLVLDVGAFCVGDDEPLSQIQFSAVGPLARGVALATFAEATQFLQAGKLLTHHGLAILVLNPPTDFNTSLQWSTLRFAVRCSVNKEPLLVSGVLVQLGQQVVYQYRAKDVLAIPAAEVACARVTVYQDQLDVNWEEFTAKPVKYVVSALSCLQTCRQADCACAAWHPKPDQPQDALLDVFRRQYFNDAGKPVKWDKATSFAVMIRYVKSLEKEVLAASGRNGLYVEPKTEDALKPHPDFQVIWLPQHEFAQVVHAAKCEMHCIGLARAGRRYGLRVHVTHFPKVFASVKPDAVYLAPGDRLTYHCGPWPYGSDRKSMAKTLQASGWECRPLQPLHSVPGGLMWAVQAVTAPPSNVLSLQHGQVVITSQDTKPTGPEVTTNVVGPAKTVQMCTNQEQPTDPWLTNDPWRTATAAVALPPGPSAANALQEMEDRLEQTLLAKLPTHHDMEVDEQESRLQYLEQQVQQLASRQGALEATVTDHHAQSTAQVQSLQQQMMVQMDMQSKKMQGMLTDQMNRLEAILAKKPRTEWWCGGPDAMPKRRVTPWLLRPLRALFQVLILSMMLRVGEARVPGPDVDEWTLGVGNPSGLHGKFHVLNSVPADVLALSETHLTAAAKRSLTSSLRSMRSRYRHVIAGAPMAPRSLASEAGQWAGVGFVSAVPCRTVATDWPDDLYQTGRLQFAAFQARASWTFGAVLYGFPEGKTHHNALQRTEAMLDFAVKRLSMQPGPRFLAGDFNFQPEDLAAVQVLRSKGWVEAQDLQHERTGAPIEPTCKGATRKDHLWMSPELALAFRGLKLCHDTFADHAVMLAVFAGNAAHLERFVWPCPKAVPWKQVRHVPAPVSFEAPGDPTAQYAKLWHCKEAQAADDLQHAWLPSMQGRGQQLKPQRRCTSQAPLKQGRIGDVCPAFFGFSAMHAKQFRQLRRLQNYCRWATNNQSGSATDNVHGIGLWNAIVRAPGFSPSFPDWWRSRQFVSPQDPFSIPPFCPDAHTAKQIFEAVYAEVRALEQRLNQAKASHRAEMHTRDKNLLFREVARNPAAPVETLLHKVHAEVESVDTNECAIILTQPAEVRPTDPLWIAGAQHEVIYSDHDKIWVSSVDDVQPGHKVAQTQYLGDFHDQWRQRWCRHDSTPFTHWATLIDFAKQVIKPCQIPHLQVTTPMLLAEFHRKKKTAATGLDGVSRQDWILADENTLESMISAFTRAEQDGQWPRQLLAGKVHSLAKTESASTVGDYRPITVFGLAYRAWSSLHSRHLLAWAEQWVDDSVYGNRQGRQAADLWHHVMLHVKNRTAQVNAFQVCQPTLRSALIASPGFRHFALRFW